MYFSFLAGQPSRSTLLADSVDSSEAGSTFGKIATAFQASRTVTPFIMGFLAEIIGFSETFKVGALISFIGVIIVVVYAIETKKHTIRKNLKRELIEAVLPEKKLSWLYTFTSIDRFAWSLWFPLLNAYLGERFGMGPSEVGMLNSIINGVSSILGYTAGKMVDSIGFLKTLTASEVLGAISALGLGMVDEKLVALPFITIGIAIALWIPSYNTAVTLNTQPRGRGKTFSKLNTFRIATSAPAPWIGGLLSTLSISAPFILSSIIMCINSVGVLFFKVRKHKE